MISLDIFCSLFQGLADAQNQLGLMFLHGIGTVQDFEQAKYWFELSSSQGDGNATFNLSTMMERGLGFESDAEQAHLLLLKARDQGSDAARKLVAQREAEKRYQEKTGSNSVASSLEILQASTDVAFRILRSNNFRLS
jgi:TPR repeat protein